MTAVTRDEGSDKPGRTERQEDSETPGKQEDDGGSPPAQAQAPEVESVNEPGQGPPDQTGQPAEAKTDANGTWA